FVHDAAALSNTEHSSGQWALSPAGGVTGVIVRGRTADGLSVIRLTTNMFGNPTGVVRFAEDGTTLANYPFPTEMFNVHPLGVSSDNIFYMRGDGAWRTLNLETGEWGTFSPAGMPAYSTLSSSWPLGHIVGDTMYLMGHVFVSSGNYNPVYSALNLNTLAVTTLRTVSSIGSAWNQKPDPLGYVNSKDFAVDPDTNTAYLFSDSSGFGGPANVYVVPLGSGDGEVIATADMGTPAEINTPIFLPVGRQNYVYAFNQGSLTKTVVRKLLTSAYPTSVVDVGVTPPLPGTNFSLSPYLIGGAKPPEPGCFWTDLVRVQQTGCD